LPPETVVDLEQDLDLGQGLFNPNPDSVDNAGDGGLWHPRESFREDFFDAIEEESPVAKTVVNCPFSTQRISCPVMPFWNARMSTEPSGSELLRFTNCRAHGSCEGSRLAVIVNCMTAFFRGVAAFVSNTRPVVFVIRVSLFEFILWNPLYVEDINRVEAMDVDPLAEHSFESCVVYLPD
jgi:hypothetical protein